MCSKFTFSGIGITFDLRDPSDCCFFLQFGFKELDLSTQERQSALLQALRTIVSAVSSNNVAFVVGCSEKSTSRMKYRELLRATVYQRLNSERDVHAVLESRLAQYMEDRGWGIILFLFSVLLSKGIHKVGDLNSIECTVKQNAL